MGDFNARISKDINMTNATIDALERNMSKILAACLVNIKESHFDLFELVHLASSSLDNSDDTTDHLFGVTYELIIWDRHSLKSNQEAVVNLIQPESDRFDCLAESFAERANITITEIFPTSYPVPFNDTIIAPDTESSNARPRWLDVRLVIFFLTLPNYLVFSMSFHPREGLG